MKRNFLFMVLAIGWLGFVWGAETSGTEEVKKRPVVVVVNKTVMGDPFLVTIGEEAKRRGNELGFDVLLRAGSAIGRSVVDQQLEIIDEMIARRVDGIFLLPADSTVIVPAVKKANAAGIPVITLDTAAYGGSIVTHIGTDNVKGAEMAAEAMIQVLKERGIASPRVAMIEGDVGQQTAIDRKLGFHERIAKEPWIKIVASVPGNWSTAGAAEAMEQILKEHPELDAVYAACDMMGIGAYKVLKRFGKEKQVQLILFDGLPEGVEMVRQGKAVADVAQHPKRMGKLGAEIMASLIIDKVDPATIPPIMDSGVEIVTKENVDAFMKANW